MLREESKNAVNAVNGMSKEKTGQMMRTLNKIIQKQAKIGMNH